MWNFSIGLSFRLLMRTLPFVLFRIAVYFGAAFAYLFVTGTGAGIGWGIGGLGDDGFRAMSTFWGGAIGFGIVGLVMYWIREYLLYIVKAGHIAVLVKLIDEEPIPEGRSQIGYARAEVTKRFGEASILFAVDQLIRGVLKAITGLIRGIFTVLPIPGARQLVTILRAFLRVAVGFIDEVILAYNIRTKSDNPWQSARTALVLYGQNYKPMLINAAWITVFVYGLAAIVFLIVLAPAAAIANFFPGGWSAAGVVFALILAWSVKAAFLEPFAVACLMQTFFKAIEGQTPNPEWENRLEGMSDKFRELKEKAVGSGAPADVDAESPANPAPQNAPANP